jgi:hypothetical protein
VLAGDRGACRRGKTEWKTDVKGKQNGKEQVKNHRTNLLCSSTFHSSFFPYKAQLK